MNDIIIKNYDHINRSLPNWDTPVGKRVKNKDHYDRLCKEAGMVSSDSARSSEVKLKEYKLSDKAKDIIRSAKLTKDRNGNVKLSDRTIDAMRSMGALQREIPKYMKIPDQYKQGGFK